MSPDQVSKLEQVISDFSEEGKYNNEEDEDEDQEDDPTNGV